MTKALAELIAGLIPGKMARNRWRGILRFGLWKTLRLKRDLRKPRPQPDHYLAVCAIAKDEGPYFKEWIEWHRKMGATKFYIYDNGSSDETRTVLQPYIESGLVDYRFFPGRKRQIAAYDDCMAIHRRESRWIAFIDLDEFIVPVADKTVVDFLRKMEDASAVEINWLVYGSNFLKEKTSEPVMHRFTRHSERDHWTNRHVKSIVDPRRVVAMTGCHEAARLTGRTVDSHGEEVTENFRIRRPIHDVIKINHYAVRSRQEFEEKQLRGRASGKQNPIDEVYFEDYDKNDIEEGAIG